MSINEVRITVPPLVGTTVGRVGNHRAKFDAFAVMVSAAVGTPVCFYAALAIVAVWLAIGKPLQWNNTWQLIMNTISSIITFWMVFVLQASQNRDTRAQQLQFMDLRNAVAQQDEKIDALQRTVDELVQALKASQARDGKACP